MAGMSGKKSGLVAKRRNQRDLRRVLAPLAFLVAIVISTAFMLPAISMTHGDLVCGMEEHSHTKACYEQVLVCGMEEGEGAQPATDDEPAVEGHKHTKACYEKQLTCDIPEHKHTDACYAEAEPEPVKPVDEDVTSSEGVGDESASQDAIGNGEDAGQSANQDTYAESQATDNQYEDANLREYESIDSESEGMPAQTFEATLKDADGKDVVIVNVKAPKGALPENVMMKIDGVDAKKVWEPVQGAVKRSAAKDTAMQKAMAHAGVTDDIALMTVVDIGFLDEVGNVVEPAKKLTVKITSDMVRDMPHPAHPFLARVTGNRNAKDDAKRYADAEMVVKKVKVVNQDEKDLTEGAEDTLKFKAEKFGPYAIMQLADAETADQGDVDENETKPVESDESENQDGEAELDEETNATHVEGPAMAFEREVADADGNVVLKVAVDVPENTLPEGANMRAILVEDAAVIDAATEAAADDAGIDARHAKALAADITFVDADSNPIEPAGDVHVTMTAPIVAEQDQLAVVHVDDEANAQVVNSEDVDKHEQTVAFDASEFSVYALVYTVDFHWEVNGQTYEFSIPGGGFVTLAHVVQALGISSLDAQGVDGKKASENESESAEEGVDEGGSDAQEGAEGIEGGDDVGEIEIVGKATAYENAIRLNGENVSEDTWGFLADVERAEFSNPELAWVGNVGDETTVGALKEANELECEYSAELTEGQITEINAQLVEAGDWALISLKPFASEEALTVTMKNGDQFTIRVTDVQYGVQQITSLDGETGALVNAANNNALLDIAHSVSGRLQAVAATIDSSAGTVTTTPAETMLTEWTFTKVLGTQDQYYISSPRGYLNIGGSGGLSVSEQQQALTVQTKPNATIRIKHPDNNNAVNNTGNSTANGYGTYGSDWDSNPGEWFTIYALTYPDDPLELDGKSLTIINNRDGGSSWQALRDEIDGVKDSRGYYMSGNGTSYSVVDGVDYSSNSDIAWTFDFVSSDSSGSYYRINTSNGYLFIDPNVTKKSDMPSGQSHNYEHALRLASAPGDGSSSDGTLIRVVSNGDGTYLLQNRNGVSLWNYGNNQFWLSTLTQDGENQTSMMNSRYRLAQRMESPHVTVHYVDRAGNVLTGVQYTGGNTAVIDNHNGTFTIPYDISGNVDLRSQFNFTKVGPNQQEYTYANTHLDGKDASGNNLEHEGYVIDSLLTASNGDLIFKSDSGETNSNMLNNPPMGNLNYGTLTSFSLSQRVSRRPSKDGDILPYVVSTNKDIYVVLDPLPTGSSSGGAGAVNPGDVEAPSLSKTMQSNDDGTYTLSLEVDAHAKNASDTNKANVLFVVDTSSSMRATTTDNAHNRIMDTHDEVLNLGNKLLAYNGSHPGAVEVSMITFDGGVDERLDWTTDADTFQTAVNEHLRYYYLHTGTDWEDGMKEALKKLLTDTDEDPTFVIFFTDGEPSQYTNFHGAGTNGNPDPTGTHTGATDPGVGYPNFYSYFLSREASKDEMRAIVNTGASLYGIYAYNPPPEQQEPAKLPYNSYYGPEGGSEFLHNAIKYGYNTTASLEDNYFYKAEDTESLKGAFDKIFNLITESVGFSNVVVEDGIAAGVTSSTVVDGDVSGFTYVITDKSGNLAYKVTVAPNGVPEEQTVANGTPLFWFSENGPPVVGRVESVPTTKIKVDGNGDPILDSNNKIQTEVVNVNAYYYKDANDKEFIMPIATTGENVVWDLSPLGTLKDGYSYEVNFVVWPNQEAYDLVADLNNGKRPDLEAAANWSDQPILEDSNHRQYRKGGFAEYPYISRYEDNGVYSAMSNTDQGIDYYKIDKKIEDGENVTVITGPFTTTVNPPDPMPLTASMSKIEKQWNVERDAGIFAQYLYNTDGTSKEFTVDFDVYQGSSTTPYTTFSLGWDPTANNGAGAYIWAPDSPMKTVNYAGHIHQIGTRWAQEFSIATGLMLSEGEMEELGLNKSLYPSATYNNTTYYVLEEGHDYTIKEKGTAIGYEFDFSAPVYHPMLVDGVLKSVNMNMTNDGAGNVQSVSITSMTDNTVGLSSLLIENTLRGYINLNKIVYDKDNNEYPSDDTKFEYVVTLNSPTDPGPFVGKSIPWYGISGLFYHDANDNYYQMYEAEDRTWRLKDERGDIYIVTSEGFDPDDAEAQQVTYRVSDNQTRTIEVFGNQTIVSNNNRTATATLKITQSETLSIANVPVGTTYSITETVEPEYTLIGIVKEVKDGDTVESSENASASDLANRTIAGEIVANRDNRITFKNKVDTGSLKITKTIKKNGNTDASATGTFYYAVYKEEYNPDAFPAQNPVRTGHIDVSTNGTAEVTEPNLKIGTYYVYELTGEGGTPIASNPAGIFSDGKYYAVTTTGSPASVTVQSTPTVAIVNNYETISVTAEKTWEDLSTNTSHEHQAVFFKLFYRTDNGDVAVADAKLKELPSQAPYTVSWTDVLKRDENGNEREFIVKEYIRKEADASTGEPNGEYEEDGHYYTESAPVGYMGTENGLHITNTQSSHYDPRTTYSGSKIWEDTSNGGASRPGRPTVKLKIDKTGDGPSDDDDVVMDGNGQPIVPDWPDTEGDEWTYTFHNLPVYDGAGNLIRYYAVEEFATGYSLTNTTRTPTNYTYKGTYSGQQVDNDGGIQVSSDITKLPFVLIRLDGYNDGTRTCDYHIWTIREVNTAEQAELIRVFRTVYSSSISEDNVRFVYGLPVSKASEGNVQYLYHSDNPAGSGYKVQIYKRTGDTVWVEINRHEHFQYIYIGALDYNYTAGSTSFTNTLNTESFDVLKTWGEGQSVPDGAEVTIELKGTIPGVATDDNPNPAPVPISLAEVGVTQTHVKLNGGNEGGDDTAENPWKYSWSGLPSYDRDGHEITYSATETSYVIDGKTVDLNAFAPTTGSDDTYELIITNQIPNYSFDILKVVEGTETPLPGAQFTIQAVEPTSNISTATRVGEAVASNPETTGENGQAKFENIVLGYYEIVEAKLPDGYILTDEAEFYIKVDAQGVKLLEKVITDGKLSFKEAEPDERGKVKVGSVTVSVSENAVIFIVENTPGAALPNSGGIGVGIYAIFGGVLVLLAGGLLLRTARRERG